MSIEIFEGDLDLLKAIVETTGVAGEWSEIAHGWR